MDEIPKHFEKQAPRNVTINCDKKRKEVTSVKSNSDTEQSNMQVHVVNWIPANGEQKENPKHIPVHRNIDKQDENTNTCT